MVTITDAHTDLIHDAQLDYYGKLLATCSSDKSIKIFEIDGEQKRLVDTLRGHDGAVWQVSWGHPKFGPALASCGYDGKVIIWREENGSWHQSQVHKVHGASVNSVQWGPPEYGPLLLCASSDGNISVIGGEGEPIIAQAHNVGVNAASWAPAGKTRQFVTGGCDNLVKVWTLDGKTVTCDHTLQKHTDWVRDVAWSPSLLQDAHIASVSQDKSVIIWTLKNGEWTPKSLSTFPDVVWRVSWSLSGNILAVSGGDNKVTLWKETLSGDWESAGDVEE